MSILYVYEHSITLILYSGNFFKDNKFRCFLWISQLPRKLILKNLIIVYKCNDNLVDPWNLIHEMF